MKKTTTGLILGFILFISSCVTTKTYTTEEKKMRIEKDGETVFIEKANGERITGKKLSKPSSLNRDQSWLKIDDKKVQNSEIVAFQDKNAYSVKFGDDRRWTWAKQLKRGKINLYYYEVGGYKSGNTNVPLEERFVFKKGAGKLLELSISDIAEMLKDNKRAYSIFTAEFGSKDKKLFPKQLNNHPKVLFEAIDVYNGNI